MGDDLVNEKGEKFRFSMHHWPKMLDMAVMYGWKQAGTINQDDPDWEGSYMGNSGQMVVSKDAKALANALTKGLSDIPDKQHGAEVLVITKTPLPPEKQKEVAENHQAEYRKVGDPHADKMTFVFKSLAELDPANSEQIVQITYHLAGDEELIVTQPNFERSFYEMFSGRSKQKIRVFIRFCNGGAFRIF